MSGETEKAVSGWTVDTLHVHMIEKINDLVALLQERFDTQQTAMSTALAAAEKAVATALLSAEKAVAKAEVAADKRFESMNEFRGQLNDQAATLMPRAESETRFTALAEKFSAEVQRNADARSEMQSRLDLSQGARAGVMGMWATVVGGAAIMSSIIALIIAFRK